MEINTLCNRKVQQAGWELGRTSLADIRRHAAVLLMPQNTAMADNMLPNSNSSNGTGILQQNRSTKPL